MSTVVHLVQTSYAWLVGMDHIVVLQWGGPEGGMGIYIHEELHRSSSYDGELMLPVRPAVKQSRTLR